LLLCCLIWLLVLACPSAEALVTVKGDNASSFNTADYFEASYASANYKAASIWRLRNDATKSACAFVLPDDPTEAAQLDLFMKERKRLTFVALFATWDEALASGCLNYEQTAFQAQYISNVLEKSALARSADVVLLGSGMSNGTNGTFGGPYADPYLPHQASALSDLPDLPTLIIERKGADYLDARVLNATIQDELVRVDVADESGAWNVRFSNIGYCLFNWLSIALLVSVLVFGLLLLFSTMWKSFLSLDMRIQAIIATQLASLFYLVSLTLPWSAWTRVFFANFANLMFDLSLYYIILFWLITLRQAAVDCFTIVTKILLIIGSVASFGLWVMLLTSSVQPLNSLIQTLITTSWSSVAGVSLLLLVLFALQARKLLLHRAVVSKQISPEAVRVLLRLFILVPFAVLAMWFECITYLVLQSPGNQGGDVDTVTAIWVIERMLLIGRAAGFVLGLSVNVISVPGETQGEGGKRYGT